MKKGIEPAHLSHTVREKTPTKEKKVMKKGIEPAHLSHTVREETPTKEKKAMKKGMESVVRETRYCPASLACSHTRTVTGMQCKKN